MARRRLDPGIAARTLRILAATTLALSSGTGLYAYQQFGAVVGKEQYRDRNGMGVHRRMWEQVSARVVTPQSLSHRLDRVDTIVLIPQQFAPPGLAARQWLEDWLRQGAGRTVVYFGRDFNADEYYLRQTLPHITPPQQWLARHWLARIRAVELQARLNSTPTNAFCDWFYLQVDQPTTEAAIGGGSWADQLTSRGPWPLRSRLLPPQRRYRSRQPANLTDPTQTNPLTPLLAPSEDDPQGEVTRSRWRPDEFDTLEAWNAAFRQLLRSEVLLESDTGEPLVFRLTGRQRLGDGQIIVVANGAPFLNASLVEPLFFDVGALIIKQCMPASRVALLTYDAQGLLISRVAEDGRMAGLEMFTQWPLSAIMLPAALLGLILCAYLFPTLGRPLGVAERSVSDFGLHVDALGQMLLESEDREYAQRAIADYFRTVRGEPPPPWLAVTAATQQPTTTQKVK